ncbi:MAG: tetratricopeptide repeat protein [Saprospiraceae bacterium]
MPTHSLKAILVTLYSISLFSIQAQNIAQDSLISRKYEELNLLNESGAFEEMILTGEAFRDSIVLEDSLSLPYARLMFMIGTGYYNYGADISVMEAPLLTALKIFRRHQDIGTVKVLNRLGECHVWYTGDFNTAIGYLDEALKAHADLSDDCSSVLSTVYQSRGLLFTYAADYESAYESYKHSLDCKITSKDSARIFLGLGDFSFNRGFMEGSLNTILKVQLSY